MKFNCSFTTFVRILPSKTKIYDKLNFIDYNLHLVINELKTILIFIYKM